MSMITLGSLGLEKMTPEKLGELLIDAKKAYYTTSKPIMDDHTYDTLEEILRQKNPYHRIFKKIGTPNFDTGWVKKKHTHPMSSQNKVTTFEELVHYFELKKIPAATQFVTQPKCDGLSLEIVYQDSKVVNAITRGDGRVGDSILQNVVKMQNFVPHPNHFTGSVRCEIVVTKKDFEKLNNVIKNSVLPPLSKGGGSTPVEPEGFYSNTRNAASGLSQRLDSRYADFCSLYAVDLYPQPPTEFEKHRQLQNLGFKVVDTQLCRNLNEVEAVYQKFLKNRSTYPFDIDGIVVKINNLKLADTLGFKDNRPKYQIAYKFPASSNHTQIKNVTWQVGPLGTITPVAQIEPVEISGAVITYVSLANFDLIKEKNINIGDIVQVSRRGDVIPHIDKVVTKVKSGHLSAPLHCPSCHITLVSNHKFLRCPNHATCPAQILGPLRLFCNTLEIRGISDKTIEKLYQAGRVRLPGDFYKLQVADFLDLAGLGQKSGTNIICAIQAKRTLSLVEVFDAAIIPNFSAKRIQQLINAGFNTTEKLLDLSVSSLQDVPGFKVTLAQKIVAGIHIRRQFIESILSHVKITKLVTRNSKLSNLSFAITGDLSQPRKNIEKLIVANGGQVHSAISQHTSYLIADSASTSAKYLAAKKLGVKIIHESDFQKLL